MRTYSTDGLTPVAQVLAQTWHTKIPVHLSLAPDNISSPTAVRPIYLMAPRQGYLGVVAAQAWPHLQHVLPSIPGRPGPPRPWFDWQGVPLRWQLPCGVLYDLLADAGQLPWRLTVHYTHPPDSLVGWDTGATPQAQFINALKESCFICRGPDGSASVMRMGSAAQDELWAAVQAGDVAAYRTALEGLRVAPTQRQGNPPSIPVRVLLRRATPAAASNAARPAAAAAGAAAAAAATAATAPPQSAAAGTAPEAPPQPGSTEAVRRSAGGVSSMMAGASTSVSVSGSGGGGNGMWESHILATSRPVQALQGVGGEPTSLAQLLHAVLPHIFPSPAGEPPPQAAAAAAAPVAQQRRPAEATLTGSSPPGPEESLPVAETTGRGGNGEVESTTPGAQGSAGGSDSLPGARKLRGSGEGESDGNGTGDGGAAGSRAVSDPEPTPSSGMRPEDPGRTSGVRQRSGTDTAGSLPSANPSLPLQAADSEGETAAAVADTGAALSEPPLSSTGTGAPSGQVPQSTSGGVGGRGAAAAAAATPPPPASGSSRWPACRVVVGGICPPLSAPIGWLHAALHAPDLFLYIVVRMEDETGGSAQAVEGALAGAGRAGGG